MMQYRVRKAKYTDLSEIESLISESVWELTIDDYTAEQIEGALQAAWGVDSQLIEDRTYFVVESENQLMGCGGWSYRGTLFGNDSEEARCSDELNPKKDAARIRAFFVKPSHARKGVGSILMNECEKEARKKGFSRLALMATLPGQRLYARHGFVAGDVIEYSLGNNLFIKFVPMSKDIYV